MRRYLRLLAALVLITVVFTAALVGCSSLKNAYNNGDPIGYGNGNNAANNNGVGNNETEDVQTSEPIVTDDIVDVDVSIFANGKTDFSIVISNLASEVVSSAANNIKAAFSSKLGTSIELNNEHYFKLAHGGLLKGPKIVVGTLSEDIISAAIEKPLRDGEYVLKVTDGSLYIIGGTEAATVQAVNYFINVFIKNESTPIYLRAGLIYEKKTSAPIINMAVAGNEIWKYGIVHDDTAFARLCAERIRAAIASASGYTLPMSTDASGESAYEILVGKTNRSASVDVNDKYSRPNVYYDIKTVGKKLVIMGEGYITLDKVASEFEKYVSSAGGFGSSFVGSVKSGNIISLVDAGAGESMFTRAADTDLRVMHWNMSDAELGAASPIYTDERMRGEIMADAILQMYPDVVTANELYDRENGEFYDAVVG